MSFVTFSYAAGEKEPVVSHFAGVPGDPGSIDGMGVAARLNHPNGITSDGGNLYVVDTSNQTIRKIVISSGVVTTLAGNAGKRGFADGIGPAAEFQYPFDITYVDKHLYVTDTSNHTIRKIEVYTGKVTTFAGKAEESGSVDGVGHEARFNRPNGITSDGRHLYVADTDNHTIRKVSISSGAVTTIAGKAGSYGSTDGSGVSARFYYPNGVTIDASNLYISDTSNQTVRKMILSSGEVISFVGKTGDQAYADGIGSGAKFKNPFLLTSDGKFVYIADTFNHLIRKADISSGKVTTIAGIVKNFGSVDGVGSVATFYHPYGLVKVGNSLYVTDTYNNTIRQIVFPTQ